jgi:hypothetical protein
MTIEKQWVTKAGLKAEVVMVDVGFRCGYVDVTTLPNLVNVHYDHIDVDVHGGLTYSNHRHDRTSWWVGFDTGHHGDSPNPEYLEKMGNMSPTFGSLFEGGTYRTLEYCVEQCEQLAEQLKALP